MLVIMCTVWSSLGVQCGCGVYGDVMKCGDVMSGGGVMSVVVLCVVV